DRARCWISTQDLQLMRHPYTASCYGALRETSQLGTELPQTLGSSLVIRRAGRLHRAFFHEILACDSLHLRGGRQIDERLRALRWAEGGELGDPNEQRKQ